MILHPKKNSIHDEYFVTDQVLGKGANRPVVLCINKKTNVKYALKVLEDSARSRREITTHWKTSVNSQFIVQIADLFECMRSRKKYFLLVLEYMEGGELFNKIIKRNKPFTEKDVAKMMFQICSAVNDLHERNIAHRDLILENILLSSNEEECAVIKITDFGFAKEANSHESTQCYSIAYEAPELLEDNFNKKYDLSCDIWSLGVILFIFCFGFPPFQNCDFDSLDMSQEGCSFVSQEAKDLICAMLNKTPEKRIKIKDIMNTPWISNWSNVIETKLISLTVLKNNEDNWSKVKEEYGIALENLRIVGDEKMSVDQYFSNEGSFFRKHTLSKVRSS